MIYKKRRLQRKIGDKTYIKHSDENSFIENILITAGAGIGNVINLTPMIITVKEIYKDAEIDLFTLERNKDVLEGWDIIRKIYNYPDNLPTRDYDFIIEGMPVVNQYTTSLMKYDKIYKGNYESMRNIHEIQAHMNILCQLGVNTSPVAHTYMHIDSKASDLINRTFRGKYIAICAGAKTEWLPQKQWGFKNFAELIKLLLKAYKNHKIVVIGVDDEKEIFKYIKNKRVIDCIDKYSIQETAAIISKCDFIVGNDTGPMHIASALDIPSYVIFGPGCIHKNRPQNKSKVISKYLPCSPCDMDRQKSRLCKDYKCMEISPEDVFNEIQISKNELQKYEYDIGCWMTVYNRYDLLLCTITSILNCKGLEGIKFVICNDGSDMEKIKPLLEDFVRRLESRGVTVAYIHHNYRWGKEKYHLTLQQCMNELKDCQYQMAIPADWIFNPYLFEVARACFKYLKDRTKGIAFHVIEKRGNRINEREKHFKYFTDTYSVDWFPYIFCTDFVNQFMLSIINYNLETGTGTTRTILQTARRNGYRILKYEESLGQHCGCLVSSMNPAIRAKDPFYMTKLNLWDKPRILEEED